MNSLQLLDISDNYFHSSVPNIIYPSNNNILSPLEVLLLDNNMFTGILTSSLCNIHTLHSLIISNNNFMCYDACYKLKAQNSTADFRMYAGSVVSCDRCKYNVC